MTTRIKRVVSDFAKHGMSYLLHRDQIAPLEHTRDAEKKWLKTHIDKNGEVDEVGNRNAYFDSSVPGPGSTSYYGLQQRRIPGQAFMNEDEVIKFVESKVPEDHRGRVLYQKTVDVVDTEALYVLVQEKVITDKQLRSLIRHKPDQYQLWPITEPRPEPQDDE